MFDEVALYNLCSVLTYYVEKAKSLHNLLENNINEDVEAI